MNGIMVVDKPKGMTSHDVVQRARRILQERRIGHTGTLDPLATGVLVLCIGKGTRIARYFEDDDKEYVASMHLGVTTDTEDADGSVLATTQYVVPTIADIERVLQEFRGPIVQRPPVFSAIKVRGVPSHRLARKGIAEPLPERRVTIHALELIDHQEPLVTIRVCCSKGTYIRSLCAAIGERLGMGAHVTQLQRTRSGSFRIEQAVTLEDLEEAAESGGLDEILLPLTEAVGRLPEVRLDDAQATRVLHGNPVEAGPVPTSGDPQPDKFRIMALDGRLIAIGTVRNGRIVPETVLE